MSFRLILHIPRRTIKLLLYLAVGLAVIFLALTRTQVGRDGLRKQIERQFNSTFEGRLQIGRLQGNLLNTLYAHQIQLMDSAGVPVASIDAAVLQPTWLELLSGTLSLHRITLIQPEFDVLLGENGVWNVNDVFKKRERSTRAPLLDAFTSSEIKIMDGRINTRSSGRLPAAVERGSIFDYANASITNLQAKMNVEWLEDEKLFDIDELSFRIESEDIELADLYGQIRWAADRIEFNEVFVASEATSLAFSGYLDRPAQLKESPELASVDIDVNASPLDAETLRQLFPGFPLSDTLRIASRIRGKLNALDIQSLAIKRGGLDINGSGYVRGYPDSLSFIAFLSKSTLSRPDLHRILPEINLDAFAHGFNPYVESMQARGAINIEEEKLQAPHYGKITFDIENDGRLSGSAEFSREPSDSLLAFKAFLSSDSLNLASIVQDVSTHTMLSGTVALQGAGTSIDHVFSDVELQLKPSAVGNVAIDTLEISAYYEDGTLDLRGMAGHALHGSIVAGAEIRLRQAVNSLKADVRLAHFNAGSLMGRDSLATNIDARINVQARGSSFEDLRGTVDVAVDPSEITQGNLQQEIPAHRVSASFTDLADGRQSLQVDGDIVTAQLTGTFNLAQFKDAGRSWSKLIETTIGDIVERPTESIPFPENLPLSYPIGTASPYAFASIDIDPQPADSTQEVPALYELSLALHQTTLIQSWLPRAPYIATDARGSFKIESMSDALSISGRLQADSLIVDDFNLSELDGDISFASDLKDRASSRLSLHSNMAADSVKILGQVLPQPILAANLDDGNGRITLATKSTQRLGSQRIRTYVELLPDRNRVHFEELFLSIGNSSWTTEAPAQIDIIGKKILIPGISLQSKSQEANILQSVHLSGVLSPDPSDTASINISNITIRPISEFLNMEQPLGGLISGELFFTTTNNQPEITGSIQVDRFSLDNRVLGDVSVSSRYIPGQPDVGLQISLAPIAAINHEQFLPDAAIPAVYEENALTVDGSFRLPKLNKQATGFLDAGSLDLDLDVRRMDAFFFEYIFPNFLSRADGFLTGGGKIRGDFNYPVFDTRLTLKDGEVEIPKFNLLYSDFNGELIIDRNAIRLENGTFRDPTGGSATFNGDFLFNNYRYFSFDLIGSLDELLIMNQDFLDDLPFYGQIWASGSLTLTGPTFNAMLISNDAVTKASSELFIPITEEEISPDVGFLIFADSTGKVPDFNQMAYRKNLLSKRPEGERKFIDGLSMDLNIFAPSGSTIHLVFDPLLGDVMNAVSSGRIQIQKREGEFAAFGTLSVESGDYLFTAGDVFARRFLIDRGGTITWDGDPIDARLEIPASYRTRASVAGLPENAYGSDHIPVIIQLDISGRVSVPEVELSLRADRSDRSYRGNYEAMEAILNQSERQTDYATSVLLTNSFLLTTESAPDTGTLTNSGNQIAFTSVSQLVASQLNRFLGEALPNVDLNLGLQGESLEDPEVTYGVALYLLDQRLVIRGQGVYQNEITSDQPDLEGEFEVEVRLNSNVSVSVFLRREGDLLAENSLTSTRGAGLSYQTQFSSWQRLIERLFGWVNKKKKSETPSEQVAVTPNE